MKFLEISDGVCVSKESICLIEKTGETCRITTEYGIYETKYPYSTLIAILESDNIIENNKKYQSYGGGFGYRQEFAG